MKDGTTRQITGLVINQRWGIDKRSVENVTYTKNGEQKTTTTSGYYLTHIPTGILVTNANTQRILKELANTQELINEDDLHKIIKAVASFWEDKWWVG